MLRRIRMRAAFRFAEKNGHRLFFAVPLQINRGCVEMHARVLCFRIDASGFQEDG
jgi:hypothetical protein